jgi:hypothetical protein
LFADWLGAALAKQGLDDVLRFEREDDDEPRLLPVSQWIRFGEAAPWLPSKVFDPRYQGRMVGDFPYLGLAALNFDAETVADVKERIAPLYERFLSEVLGAQPKIR